MNLLIGLGLWLLLLVVCPIASLLTARCYDSANSVATSDDDRRV